ncbi:DUF2235 domain-containing protein [Anabaena catenula]|uniref:DUF2235 domain-containing protein n=1 Tax=Anabaena catenula FACHB-362 TaxID=2692877 RepID=A0ABR8IYZ6_9NOST|nr:DUF2235 domain-containing protein [Anabaena catenula]MBD2690824.1 DUF2235 domain-containing protein [Anabaena catenula FACHB-362]
MKRIIVCCDGTWQTLEAPYPTNVVKLAEAIKPLSDDHIYQILFYDEGLGTGNLIDKIGGGAFGVGIDQAIQKAYRFLCLNYEDGDEIYLFGFSRGAYTARCLAGLIYCSGLLKRQYIRKIPQAYELYRNRDKDTHPSGKKSVEFRQKYGENVPIEVLGCWDTVGSLGIPDLIPYIPIDNWINKKYKFFDTKLNHLIKKAFHAVAIDETRKAFDVTPMTPNADIKDQVTQIWFPGDHGCVGGGTESTRGLSDAALDWMMAQVSAIGLDLDKSCVEYGIKPNAQTLFQKNSKVFDILLPRILREVDGEFSDLDVTVKKRWQDSSLKYKPKNLEKFQDQLNAWKP